MTTITLIWLIPLPPIMAFFLILLFTHRNKWLSHSIAVGAAFLSWLAGMIVFFRSLQIDSLGQHPFESSIAWLPIGVSWFNIGVLIDPLSSITLFFVAWTVLMIFIYSVGYHNFGQPKGDHDRPGLPPHGAAIQDAHGHKHLVSSIEPMYARFFAFISLFAFGMFLLVVSDNMLTLFVGWEIMGLCSYLLIGFWYAKPSARAAAIKAFLTTRVGDVFMLLGIAYLYSMTGTLNFRAIFYNPDVLAKLASTPSYIAGLSAAGMIALLLFFGAVGKSAQFPLHVWLPDAMEGPTPVSAMIHAATMVSAGVYMLIRIYPLASAGLEVGHHFTYPMIVMASVGAFTAIFAATIAVLQRDIKRVLAYSTISQLGYMVAALGVGAYVAAAFHLVTHAFFKALLFLGSGSVIHGVEHGVMHTGEHVDPQDMFNMGGLAKKMPFTFITFVIGGLALSGFPLFTAGFWSKDEILAEAFHYAVPVFLTLAVAALLTAFYTARQITLTFLGEPRSEAAKHAVESKWTMLAPLVVLSAFAITMGWLGIHEQFPFIGGLIPNFMHNFIGGTLVEFPELLPFDYVPLAISIVVALGGLFLGWWTYKSYRAGAAEPTENFLGSGASRLIKNKYYIDEIYHFLFVRPAIWMADVFTLWMDRTIIDGILHWFAHISGVIGSFLRNAIDKPIVNGFGDAVGEGTKKVGDVMRAIQTGRVQQYMILALISLVFVGAFFYIYVFLR
jgi:NADH-quinone oxidoreductase subunit L